MMPAGIENELFQLRVSGYLPVMAHPERYLPIQRDLALAERLARHAALMVDLGALDGAHGKQEMKTARKLVQEGLATAAASDIHRPEDQTSVAAGMAWIRKQLGDGALTTMLDENPRRMLAGELPETPRSPMSRRLFVQAFLSLVVGAVCVVYAVHGMDGHAVLGALRALAPSAVALYLGTMVVTHLFRTLRWEYLLRALGTSLPFRRLLPISSVGFMAILALPVRLGEFVRPYLVARERHVRMSTMVGAVAVERIVDGLLISILFFGAYLASAGDLFSSQLRAAAWLSLVGFVGLTTFLILAQLWTDRTIAIALRLTLIQWLAPARAPAIDEKLRALISGFRALADRRNFSIFLVQSVIYWASNGIGMWILARHMNLPISLGAAFVIMAFTGVVLSLPNSPGLVGQFHAAIKMGLTAYVPAAVVNSSGMAYAIVLHGIQTLWYISAGLLSLPALSRGGRARLVEGRRARIDPRGGGRRSLRASSEPSARPASARASGAPSSIDAPSFASTAATVPAAGDSTGISIFIDSRMATVSPSATASPTFTLIFQTVPVM